MTQTSGGPQAGGRRPNGTDNFLDGLRRVDMRRSNDGWIGGVCSGLATRLGLDPLVIRALFAVLSLAVGLGVLAYLAAWLLIPDTDEDVHLEEALRNGEAASVVLLVATVLSVFGTFGWFGGGWFSDGAWGGNIFWGLLSLLLLVGGAAWLWSEWRSRPDPGFYGRHVSPSAPPPPPSASSSTTTESPAGTRGASDTTWNQNLSDTGWSHGTSDASSRQGTPDAGWIHSSGATAWTPHQAPPAPGASRPPKPPKPPQRLGRRSAGAAGTLLGTGLALAVGGGLAWAATEYSWSVNPVVIGLIGALGTLGLVVLILGLAGRTSGFPGVLAVLALLVTAGALPLGDQFVASGQVGNYAWTPSAQAGDAGPYRLGAGNGTLDLRGISDEEFVDPVQASVSFGNLKIVVPDDLTVRIEAGVGMGSIVPPDAGEFGGVDVNEVMVVGDGPIDLEIEARVGFGQILVEGNER